MKKTLALAACGTAVREYDGAADADCINLGTLDAGTTVYDCQATLRDTRRVSCVVVYNPASTATGRTPTAPT